MRTTPRPMATAPHTRTRTCTAAARHVSRRGVEWALVAPGTCLPAALASSIGSTKTFACGLLASALAERLLSSSPALLLAAMPGSPPGIVYLQPGHMPFAPGPHPGGAGSEPYGMHAGYGMHAHQQQPDFVQHMAGMSLSQQQQAGMPQQQQQQQQRPGSTGGTSANGGGRSEGRASARIARSHRAGGAYNPAEVGWLGRAGGSPCMRSAHYSAIVCHHLALSRVSPPIATPAAVCIQRGGG